MNFRQNDRGNQYFFVLLIIGPYHPTKNTIKHIVDANGQQITVGEVFSTGFPLGAGDPRLWKWWFAGRVSSRGLFLHAFHALFPSWQEVRRTSQGSWAMIQTPRHLVKSNTSNRKSRTYRFAWLSDAQDCVHSKANLGFGNEQKTWAQGDVLIEPFSFTTLHKKVYICLPFTFSACHVISPIVSIQY